MHAVRSAMDVLDLGHKRSRSFLDIEANTRYKICLMFSYVRALIYISLHCIMLRACGTSQHTETLNDIFRFGRCMKRSVMSNLHHDHRYFRRRPRFPQSVRTKVAYRFLTCICLLNCQLLGSTYK